MSKKSSKEYIDLQCECLAGNRMLCLHSFFLITRTPTTVSTAAAEMLQLAGNGFVALPQMPTE